MLMMLVMISPPASITRGEKAAPSCRQHHGGGVWVKEALGGLEAAGVWYARSAVQVLGGLVAGSNRQQAGLPC